MQLAADVHEPRRGPAHVRGPGDEPRGLPRGRAGGLRVDRRPPAGDDDRHQAADADAEHDRGLQLLLERGDRRASSARSTRPCRRSAPARTRSTFANLAIGTHELQVRAVDSSSTPDPTPGRSTAGRSARPPETTILSAPERPDREHERHVHVHLERLRAPAFECALDEAAENLFFTPCVSGVTYNDLAFGDHTLLVRAVDAAGNVDPIPAEYEWEIGGIPPVVTLAVGAGPHHREPDGALRVHRAGQPRLRVRARLRHLLAVQLAEDLHRHADRPARVPGPRARAERDHRGADHDPRVDGPRDRRRRRPRSPTARRR